MDAPADDVFDTRMVDYLQRREAGESPDIAGYLHGLDATQCAEFRALAQTAVWTDQQLPLQLRSQALLAGRYRLRRELGAGGFGKVWEAEDQQLGRRVAIKVLNLIASSTDAASSLRRERKSLARLRHPGVVGIHEAGSSDDLQYLVMDLVPGRSLDKVFAALADAGFPPAPAELQRAIGTAPAPGESTLLAGDWFTTAARIAVEMLRALEAAHAVAVLHRDLKPANVMLTGTCRPVLLDFGLASLRDEASHTFTERLLGTANYIAPEQAKSGRVGNDPRTDVYQAGLLLYELLTLAPAFALDGAAAQVIQRVMRGDFPAPRRVRPAVPRDLENICLRATELDPARRYDSVGTFREDLERWLRRELPLASRHGVVTKLLRGARLGLRRHRAASMVAAALLLGSVPAVLWAATRQTPPQVLATTVLDNGVCLEMRAAGVADFFGVTFVTDSNGERTHVMPMRTREIRDRAVSGQASETKGPDHHRLEVTYATPEDKQRVGVDAEICVRPAYDRDEVERMREGWTDLDKSAHEQYRNQPGVPIAEALLMAKVLTTRGGPGPGPGAEQLWNPHPTANDGWIKVAPAR
ncbi:MAG TPA: serine/threonine-protein kinase [Planctomycetota bacterium]|nr:serine/threonine-protein kinase [Planctomycetota bacterium]